MACIYLVIDIPGIQCNMWENEEKLIIFLLLRSAASHPPDPGNGSFSCVHQHTSASAVTLPWCLCWSRCWCDGSWCWLFDRETLVQHLQGLLFLALFTSDGSFFFFLSNGSFFFFTANGSFFSRDCLDCFVELMSSGAVQQPPGDSEVAVKCVS